MLLNNQKRSKRPEHELLEKEASKNYDGCGGGAKRREDTRGEGARLEEEPVAESRLDQVNVPEDTDKNRFEHMMMMIRFLEKSTHINLEKIILLRILIEEIQLPTTNIWKSQIKKSSSLRRSGPPPELIGNRTIR